MGSRTCTVLGVNCFAGSLEAAATAVVERARAREGGFACLSNVHVLVSAQHDDRVRGALVEAWAVFPDGAPVAWLERQAGATGAARVAGADLMSLVFVLSQPLGLRHYLFGSTPEVIDRLCDQLPKTYPSANIVGAHAPPFRRPEGDESVWSLPAIRAAEPDIVWVGLGAPKQELWMRRYARELAPALVLGVGAAFDFHAGTKRRAPAWMQQASLEWLHRLGSEPRRLAARYVRTNSEFVWRAGLELSRRRWAA